jgi:hypothetical protein
VTWPEKNSNTYFIPTVYNLHLNKVHQRRLCFYLWKRTKNIYSFLNYLHSSSTVLNKLTSTDLKSSAGSRSAKGYWLTHKKSLNKWRSLLFWSAGCSLNRASGFSYSLGNLHGVWSEYITIFDL